MLQYTYVTIFGDGTGLIVLILHHTERIQMPYQTLFYHSKSEMWNINEIIMRIGLKNLPFLPRILVVHAFLGCYTTSRINRFEHDKVVKMKNPEKYCGLRQLMATFREENRTPTTVIRCGKRSSSSFTEQRRRYT